MPGSPIHRDDAGNVEAQAGAPSQRSPQAAGTSPLANSLLGGGCSGTSCGCVAFTALLIAAFIAPCCLLEALGMFLAPLESGLLMILEGPAWAFKFATAAAPFIAVFALLIVVVVGTIVGLLLYRAGTADTGRATRGC